MIEQTNRAATTQAHFRGWRKRFTQARTLLDVAAAAIDPYRPLLANLIVTRRCNLSCGYCHEYDKTSSPVPLAHLRERIDQLKRLRTVFITLTGGEPLLHPDLPEIVAYVRARGMTALMNTNGYLLTRERIVALGQAGLFGMQVSIDNLHPNETTVKSLRPLRSKLGLLAEHATFRVRVSAVLGSGSPDEAIEVARAALELGFDAKCQLVRDKEGVLMPLDARTRHAYAQICSLRGRAPFYLSEGFQRALLRDGTIDWKCRAGARYFHVYEDGLVHFCPARQGSPGKPLADYTEADIRRAFHLKKRCTATCTQPYAHQVSRLDAFRSQQSALGDEAVPRVRLPVIHAAVESLSRGG